MKAGRKSRKKKERETAPNSIFHFNIEPEAGLFKTAEPVADQRSDEIAIFGAFD